MMRLENYRPAITQISIFALALFALAAWDAVTTVAPVVFWIIATLIIICALAYALSWLILRYYATSARIAELVRDRDMARIKAPGERIRIQTAYKVIEAAIDQIKSGAIYPVDIEAWNFKPHALPASQAIIQAQTEAPPALPTPSRPDLLPALVNCANILIVGGKGRGKTSLLQWLEWERLNRGEAVTVLDSHSQPAQWGGKVIGAGRNYESIAAAMIDLNVLLDRRYEKFSKGKSGFSPLSTFIDEFTLLPKKLKAIGYDIQDYSVSALTEGRKVGLNCVWGIHSDRVTALGLEGAADLKECFDAIVYLRKVRDDYYALVDFGDGTGDIKYAHPGPFTITRPASKVTILPPPVLVTNWPTKASEPDVIDEDSAAIEAFRALVASGQFSWRKATQAAFGPGKFGLTYNDKLRAILDKYNIDYSDIE